MKKKPSKNRLSEYGSSVFQPEDLVAIYYTVNGCGYRWGIPFKNFHTFENLKTPYSVDDLIALGGVLFDILVFDRYSIDFKDAKSGVKKLEVTVRSSESQDKQLLHKITNEFRVEDGLIDKDSIPGTNNNDHE